MNNHRYLRRVLAAVLAASTIAACNALTGTHKGDQLAGAEFSETTHHGQSLPVGPPAGGNLAGATYLVSSAVSFDGHGNMTILDVDSVAYTDSIPSYRWVRHTSMYTYTIVDDSIGLRISCFALCASPPWYQLEGDSLLTRRYSYLPADSQDVYVRTH